MFLAIPECSFWGRALGKSSDVVWKIQSLDGQASFWTEQQKKKKAEQKCHGAI